MWEEMERASAPREVICRHEIGNFWVPRTPNGIAQHGRKIDLVGWVDVCEMVHPPQLINDVIAIVMRPRVRRTGRIIGGVHEPTTITWTHTRTVRREGRRPFLNVPVTQPLVFLPAILGCTYTASSFIKSSRVDLMPMCRVTQTISSSAPCAVRSHLCHLVVAFAPAGIVCARNSELSFVQAAKDATLYTG